MCVGRQCSLADVARVVCPSRIRRNLYMKKVLAAVMGAALLLAAGVATAADVKGAITAVNAQEIGRAHV